MQLKSFPSPSAPEHPLHRFAPAVDLLPNSLEERFGKEPRDGLHCCLMIFIVTYDEFRRTKRYHNRRCLLLQEFQKEGEDKKLWLLNDISGTFRPGVLTALMGVSGAGKTTLMDVLAGRKTGGRSGARLLLSFNEEARDWSFRKSAFRFFACLCLRIQSFWRRPCLELDAFDSPFPREALRPTERVSFCMVVSSSLDENLVEAVGFGIGMMYASDTSLATIVSVCFSRFWLHSDPNTIECAYLVIFGDHQ
jgi:hypothetical protein